MDTGAAPAPAKTVKKKVKKHSVAFSAETAAKSKEALQDLYEKECEMALQVGLPSLLSLHHFFLSRRSLIPILFLPLVFVAL